MDLYDLNVYKLARELSSKAWDAYNNLDKHMQYVIGDQFIRSIDSIAANIAEGFGRFHYLDRRKFYYNARGSLLEAETWLDLLGERDLITKDLFDIMKSTIIDLRVKLNNFILKTTNQV